MDLVEDKYTVTDLISSINYGFKDMELLMHIGLTKKGFVYIKNKNGDKFTLDKDGTIFEVLGFTKNTYTNKSKYIANVYIKEPNFVYLYLDDEPYGKLDFHKSEKITKNLHKPIKELKDLIIKFKSMSESEFDFDEKPHTLNFKIKTLTK